MREKVHLRKISIKNYKNSLFKKFEIIKKENLDKVLGPSHFYMGIQSAIYANDGSLIQETERGGGFDGDLVADFNAKNISSFKVENVIRGKSLYIGNFFKHYGHFIMEGISRLWIENISEYDNYLLSPFVGGYEEFELLDFHRSAYRGLGIDTNKINILKENTAIENLDVPEKSLIINSHCNIIYRKIVKNLVDFYKKDDLNKNIYVSRESNDRIGNTKEIEELFSKNGFEIILPGQMSLIEQINTFYNSITIVGLPGSALHNNIFSKEMHTLVELGDRRSWDKPISTQLITNNISNANSHYIPFDKKYDFINTDELVNKLKSVNSLNIYNFDSPNCIFRGSFLLDADYTFHTQNAGDINLNRKSIYLFDFRNPIEGFSINIHEKSLISIRYKTMDEYGQFSDWHHSGEFSGSRGKSIILKGFMFEIIDGAEMFDVECVGYFSGNQKEKRVTNNELCTTNEGYLTGFKFLIHMKDEYKRLMSF